MVEATQMSFDRWTNKENVEASQVRISETKKQQVQKACGGCVLGLVEDREEYCDGSRRKSRGIQKSLIKTDFRWLGQKQIRHGFSSFVLKEDGILYQSTSD